MSTTSVSNRPTRRPLVISAVLVWMAVLGLVAVVGVPTMATWFGATPHTRTPLVSLALGEKPTYEWTGQGSGVVHLSYTARVSGRDSTTASVQGGTWNASKRFTPSSVTSVPLRQGEAVTRTVAIPVTCTTRTRVGVRSTAPGVSTAEVFTWVVPTTNDKGDPTCTLI